MSEIMLQRWMALGLLIVVLLIITFVAIVPLISSGLNYHEQKEDLLFRLQRSKNIVARKDSVVENIERIKQEYVTQNYFSSRDTVALASADLQKLIKSAITKVNGQLTSTQVLPSRNENGLNRVVIKVRMSSDIEGLRDILYEIETSVPVMLVDQIDIRPVRGKRNRKTRKIDPSNKLNINFQVIGFMRDRMS